MTAGSTAPPIGRFDHGTALGVLARAAPGEVKRLAETVLPDLGAVDVLKSRTGLVMLPCRDSAQGATFHVGEILVAEAHVRLRDRGDCEGYGACVGRDLEHAMAIAVLDAAAAAGVDVTALVDFLEHQSERLVQRDDACLRRVEATRTEMETF